MEKLRKFTTSQILRGAAVLRHPSCWFRSWMCSSKVPYSSCDISGITYNISMISQRKWRLYSVINMPEDSPLVSQANNLVVSIERNHLNGSSLQKETAISDQTQYSREDFNKLCRILSSSENWNEIVGDLERTAICFSSELVLKILQCCRMHGNKMLNFFSWLANREGYSHTTKTYNMAIKIAGSAKDFKHMRSLYLEMRRQRCPITPDTWTIMISQYGQAGLTDIALKKFQEMKSEGHVPKASTYKFLIIFLCGRKGRKVDQAIKMFKEMLQSGYLPDKEMVEIYLSCLCESNKILEARKSVESLCKNGLPVHFSKRMLIRSLARAGKLEDALEMSEQLESLGYPKNEYIYGSLVHGLLREGRLDEAMMNVKAMEKEGIPCTVHIYTSLMIHYLSKRQTDKANDTLKRMIEAGCLPTVVTYSAFIRGLVSNGMFSDAWSIFNKMKMEGPPPDFKTYSMFIASLCKAGRSEEGLLLLHEMLEKDIFPSSVNFKTVFFGLNREGKQELAQTVLHTKWDFSKKRKFLN